MKLPLFDMRKGLLWIGLIATAVLAVDSQYGPRDSGAVSVVQASMRSALPIAYDSDVPVAAVTRFNPVTPEIDPMSPSAWLPPPPPAPKIIEAAPTAPPLPYTFSGKFVDAGKVSVLLAKNEDTRVVHLGEVVDDVWKVVKIDNGAIEFLYLPMNMTQSLEFEREQ